MSEKAEKASSVSMPNPARNDCLAMVAALILLIAIGCERSPSGPSQVMRVNGLTITLTGVFRTAGSEVGIKITDAQGHAVEVGKVTLTLMMNMPGMPMSASAEVLGRGGNYTARVQPQMAGRWMAMVRYDGPQGSGQTVFEVNAR